MTAIQWTDRTWNPVRGCSRISEGCRNCYAERVAARFSKPGLPFHGFAKVVAPRDTLDRVGGRRDGWTGRVELVPEKLREPLSWRKPSRVFVNSMSDLFHESLSDEAIDQVFAVMALAPQHTFQVLTKRSDRMRAYLSTPGRRTEIAMAASNRAFDVATTRGRMNGLPQNAKWARGGQVAVRFSWPLPNVWVGVSVEDQRAADERIPHLLATPAAVRFLSVEPLLGPVNLRPFFAHSIRCECCPGFNGGTACACPRIGWCIVGGESGPGARPCDVAWVRSIVEQCQAASVSVFVKQLGARAYDGDRAEPTGRMRTTPDGRRQMELRTARIVRDPTGGDSAEWPEDLRVRAFPAVRA